MKIKWILSFTIVISVVWAYLALMHVRQINNFCVNNSFDVSLNELADRTEALAFTKISLQEGVEIDGIWLEPRLTYRSYLTPNIFSCDIKIGSTESSGDAIVTAGHSKLEELYLAGFTLRLL